MQTNDTPFKQNPERAVELDELDFSDDEETPSFMDLTKEDFAVSEQDEPEDEKFPARDPDKEIVSEDDLEPDMLIAEDGSRSPHEPGEDEPIDKELRQVRDYEIGGGDGLDEAELARTNPLDGKPWDGTPGEPLNPEAPYDEEVEGPEEDAGRAEEDNNQRKIIINLVANASAANQRYAVCVGLTGNGTVDKSPK